MLRFTLSLFLLTTYLSSPLLGQESPTPSPSLDDFTRVWRKASSKIIPAVVQIEVDRTAEEPEKKEQAGSKQIPDMFKQLFQRSKHPNRYKSRPIAPTSGVLISADGYVITSWFNVSGTLRSLTVRLSDGRSFPGKLLGRDESKDLALVKIEATGLPFAKLAKTDHLKVGHFVAALGRSTDVKQHTMTRGVISALDRYNGNQFQLSARTNYGNSGGAVIDIEGRLLGIVTLIHPRHNWGVNSGVGFAVYTPVLLKILPRLQKGEIIKRPRQPFLGISGEATDKPRKGIRIREVHPNTAAAKAGIKKGDLLFKLNGKRINDLQGLVTAIRRAGAGKKISITILRGDKEIPFQVVLGSR